MVMKWKKNFNLKTYEPEQKLEIRKEHLVPHALKIGHSLSNLGGFFTLFFSGFAALFHIKGKFREYQRKHEKVLDLRKHHSRHFIS